MRCPVVARTGRAAGPRYSPGGPPTPPDPLASLAPPDAPDGLAPLTGTPSYPAITGRDGGADSGTDGRTHTVRSRPSPASVLLPQLDQQRLLG